MTPSRHQLSEEHRRLLLAHYEFYRSLDEGRRAPTTAAQRHFLAVWRGTVSPETAHERAYLELVQAVRQAGLDESEVVASGFLFPRVPPAGSAEEDVGIEQGDVVDIPVRPCAGCGRPIAPERLAAIPEATRCVACQRREEAVPTDWRISEVQCPRCARNGFNSRMVWRTARDPTVPGYFLGCSRFPACRYVDRS